MSNHATNYISLKLHKVQGTPMYTSFWHQNCTWSSFTPVTFTHLGLQITSHPNYQICPVVQPCLEQDQSFPQQNKKYSACYVSAVFQCTAEGTLPLTFTWWRNVTKYTFLPRWIYSWWWETEVTVTKKVESNHTCFIRMVNDRTSQLSFSNTSTPVFEEYFCKVSDVYGRSTRSEPALLWRKL